MTVGELIRLHREAAGLTQWDLSRSASIAETTVWRIETGKVQPSLSTLRRIALALNTSITTLTDTTETP